MSDIYLEVLYILGFEYLYFDLYRFLVNIRHPKSIQNQAKHIHQEENDIREYQPFISYHRNTIVNYKGKKEQASIQKYRIVKFLSYRGR